MFCQNCGSKTDENAYVCVHCGIILKKGNKNKIKLKNNHLLFGLFSVALGIISIILSTMLFFNDINSVGMYTEIYERVLFVLSYSVTAIVMTSASFIFSLISKNRICRSFGLFLSILSLFFIITEIIIVVIY